MKTLLLVVPPSQVEEMLKDGINYNNVERGLFRETDAGQSIIKIFNEAKDIGFFPIGIVVEENNGRMEILYQPHPKQTNKQKEEVVKPKKGKLYKI